MVLKILKTLNEAQTRWFVAREAMLLGRGGVAAICRLTGVSKPTVIKGMKELKTLPELGLGERIRRPGGRSQETGGQESWYRTSTAGDDG